MKSVRIFSFHGCLFSLDKMAKIVAMKDLLELAGMEDTVELQHSAQI